MLRYGTAFNWELYYSLKIHTERDKPQLLYLIGYAI